MQIEEKEQLTFDEKHGFKPAKQIIKVIETQTKKEPSNNFTRCPNCGWSSGQ